MKKLKTLIVEDDEVCLLYLKDLFKDHTDIIGDIYEAQTFSEAAMLLADNVFDLSILDNKLDRNKNSFELFKLFDRRKFGLIVYTSTIRDAGIENTLEMLPNFRFYKPYDEDSTAEFMIKLKAHLKSESEKADKYVTLTDKRLTIRMSFENIFYLEAEKSYTKFVCKDEIEPYKTYLESGNLGQFEFLLNSDVFLKCHRSYFVNKHLIKRIKREGSEIYFDLSSKIPVAYYADHFKDWLSENGF